MQLFYFIYCMFVVVLCIGSLSCVNYVVESTRSGKDATVTHICVWFSQMFSLEINTKKQQRPKWLATISKLS